MFDRLRSLFTEKPVPEKVANASAPETDAKRKAWVMMEDGRVGYIHHYKINGLFGVRPVGFESGLHYPNTAEHWTEAQKLMIPEELALTICQLRGAMPDEIPPMWRP